jgi:hypothetical protein
MSSHTTDWFPGRVTKEYRENYPKYGEREGWCKCGCKMIRGMCVCCNNTQLDPTEE